MVEECAQFDKISIKPIKGSRKSKKSWRKHGDIADVEEHLDDVRRDERTGGSFTDKPNNDLFILDTIPGEKDKIPRKKTKTEGIEVFHDDDEEYVPRKKKLAARLARETETLKKQITESREAQVQTIWGQPVMKVTDAFLEPTVKRDKVRPKTLGDDGRGSGGGGGTGVELPHAGSSYNPDYDSHQDLLLRAHEAEVRKQKERQRWNSKVKMVSVEELKKQSKQYIEEMSQGLVPVSQTRKDEDDDVTMTSSKPDFAPPPVSAENRKPAQKRRKEILLKKARQMKLAQKQRKRMLNDIVRIKSLKREIRRRDDDGKRSKTDRRNTRLNNNNSNNSNDDSNNNINDGITGDVTKRLGRHKFVEPDVDVKLSDELTGSLRGLSQDGNLIRDRFKSFQRRNIIEPRNPVLPHRKYKRKVVVRRSYKNARC